MRSKWIQLAKKGEFKRIGERFGVDQVIARVVVNRGLVTDEEFEEYFAPYEEFPRPAAGCAMKDMEKGARILLDEIKKGTKILAIGDYDADGVCSTVILMKAIGDLGGEAAYRIPHRIYDGYGMNEEMVKEAVDGGFGCIITCDNGISAMGPVGMARDAGIKVIITDHHTVPFEENDGKKTELIPPADAVIDPHRSDCPYPFKDICGAVVALRFVEALLGLADGEKDCSAGAERLRGHLPELYDLAAIATTTDVMPLVGENRRIVKRGINKIPTTSNLGLRVLCEKALPGKSVLTGYDIGFVIGPCINAAGRVDTAVKAVEFFLSDDEQGAADAAAGMAEFNDRRKSMTKSGTDEGIRLAKGMEEDKVLVIYQPELHESIAGLVAGRVREAFGKPTIVITDAATEAKGSCRSVEGYNIIEEITRHKELFIHYGGHPLAAGFSIKKDNIDILRSVLNDECSIPLEDLVPKVKIDVPMPLSYIGQNPGIVEQLSVLEPTGKGNEKPVFAVSGVALVQARRIGKDENFLKLTALCEGRRYKMLLFKDADEFLAYCAEKFSDKDVEALIAGRENDIRLNLVYTPSFNEYKGERTLQFVIDHYQ